MTQSTVAAKPLQLIQTNESIGGCPAGLDSSEQTWENSWVRFPRRQLNAYSRAVLRSDLRAGKRITAGPLRFDVHRFSFSGQGVQMLRIPISYLLKLGLADGIGQVNFPALVKRTGEEMLEHFLNGNTSPEPHSFCPVSQVDGGRVGPAVAVETLMRCLLAQLVVPYTNRRLGLENSGPKIIVCFCPMNWITPTCA